MKTMSTSNELRSVLEHLHSAIKNEYSRGYEDGYASGLKDGREEAAATFSYVLTEYAPEPRAECDEDPKQESSRADVPELPPHQHQALEWLRAHPGATQQAAYNAGGTRNKNVFYKLAKGGFARKEGPRFFAI